MKKQASSLFLVLSVSLALSAGCSTAPTTGTTGTGGTAGGGGSTGSGVGVAITPDASGWVMGDTNSLMLQGAWYAYGDGVGADGMASSGTCVMKGGHPASACSMITTPAPGMFMNTGGMMCTSGTVAQVIPAATPDYSNIWGAGIGLDWNNSGGLTPVKGVFNATAKGVKGVSFEINAPPLPGLRVEFPTPITNGSANGSNFWGGNASWTNSPVKAGLNTIMWADVTPPGPMPGPAFDPSMIEGIQFHVPTSLMPAAAYTFCISNLKLLM